MIRIILFLLLNLTIINTGNAEDGYRLWLRYDKIEDSSIRSAYQKSLSNIYFDGEGAVFTTAKHELTQGIKRLLDLDKIDQKLAKNGLIVGLVGPSPIIRQYLTPEDIANLKTEGFIITKKGNQLILAALDEKGILYGSFHLLRMMQMHQKLGEKTIIQNPKIKLRLLNHWDNLDGTVERGYAGFSIWNWHQLPEYIDQRYIDYARANASIGINGAAVTNVNANELIFRKDYLQKVAALADQFRVYGIKIYLTARFSSAIELGGLETADPLNPEVQKWWNEKTAEIYQLIPDFGGYLVKANSEGQPGPQDYGRNHSEGANMLADAVSPFGGVVMWRAFVYSNEEPEDRAKQAYNEFVPLDGSFRKNVLIQVKNGPIDFQPREPIHPLFGAMPKTPLMMEFQITKEYLGQGTHTVGLGKMYEEILQTDTYAKGHGTTVAKIIEGDGGINTLSGMAGVANIGTARNWTGNLFGQADWYAFGRLAWDPYMASEDIFDEWTRMTFSNDPEVVEQINFILENSYESCVKYMTPLGLHHIMAAGHHFGPGPWVDEMSRADWTSVYYHKADKKGLGFNRTSTGTEALSQYHQEFIDQYKNPTTCSLSLLLWFHHIAWDQTLSTGRSLWDQLCYEYHQGAKEVKEYRAAWKSLEKYVDIDRFRQVDMHMQIQEKEAIWWRDACLSYFQSFSNLPIPQELEQPKHDLKYYMSLNYPYSPGIRPRW